MDNEEQDEIREREEQDRIREREEQARAEAKAEQDKINELKGGLIQDYERNALRLKRIPDELTQLEESLKFTNEDIDMKVEEADLRAQDLELRKKMFRVCNNQAKFEWESSEAWMENQRDLLDMEIKKIKFNQNLHKIGKLKNETNNALQKRDIEDQRTRCIEAHKTVLGRLKEECNVSNEQIGKLKQHCIEKCCR